MDTPFSVPLDLALREWKTASSLLATSMERYINACHGLKSVYPNPSHTSNNTSPIWDVFDDMDKELDRLESYPSKLRQARVEVSLVRNQSPRLAPIMILPRELLEHIFELVLLAEHWEFCILDDSHLDAPVDWAFEPHKYPDTLSCVCTYWHQVVTNTPSLWARIDLVVSGRHMAKNYARASRLVKRSASLPLFVRMHSPGLPSSNDIQQLTSWLTPIANRIYSLDMSEGRPCKDMLTSVLRCWFEHGTPGTVKELSLVRRGGYNPSHDHGFIVGPTSAPIPNSWSFDIISPQRFEAFFRPIEILRLDGLFPLWHSQAYHGLVHLKLWTGRIKEAELINLLSQNPQLRTLAFNLDVLNTQPRDNPVTPIRLPQLEILSLYETADTELWSLLRLITPGSGPIRLSLRIDSITATNNFTQTEEIRAFIQRSNITAIYVIGAENDRDTWFPRTLSSFPQLRTLALDYYSLVHCDAVGYGSVCSSLRELCLMHCTIDINVLKRLLGTHSIQVLRVGSHRILDGGPQSLEELQNELSKHVSNVKCYQFAESSSNSDLYLNWDFVDF
ncbi:hypothetical protein FRC12_000385 [Ceratobasidium sp. 428]|nr:hypothetical protein FRC12_000385 [Ceratobasidium sp. 428]